MPRVHTAAPAAAPAAVARVSLSLSLSLSLSSNPLFLNTLTLSLSLAVERETGIFRESAREREHSQDVALKAAAAARGRCVVALRCSGVVFFFIEVKGGERSWPLIRRWD